MKKSNSAMRTAQNKKRNRSVVQSVRLSLVERAALRHCSRGAGVSVSDYVRALLYLAPTFKEAVSK